MDAVRRPFTNNTAPNSVPYTTRSCFYMIEAQRTRGDDRVISYNRAFEITG